MPSADAGVRARVFCLLGLLSSAVAWADDPRDWLSRMNEALTSRNYDGVFVHLHGGRAETMRIVHRVQDGRVMERLVSLDGSGREFIRTGAEVACYLPDQRRVVVERRPDEAMLLGNLPRFDEETLSFYDLRHEKRTRLMGRETRVIAVLPRDEFRYGYRIWIDERTSMPLKTQLCDARGKVIEQMQFASLTLPARIADAEFEPDVSTEGFEWVRQSSPRAASVAGRSSGLPWRVRELPPGFRMTLRASQDIPGAPGPVEHLVFSDGLASVSVFVESRPPEPAMKGPAKVGASSAFTTEVDGHQVTAVGEVPPQTVRSIANSFGADRVPVPSSAGPALASPPQR
jgi:sigma-E factor negative regulatory protein RseB